MRVIWVLGALEEHINELRQQLSEEHTGVPYYLRSAEKTEEIPKEHFENKGVAVLLDSFHPDYPGFKGLRILREKKFQGPIFLFGEPAPEKAIAAFLKEGLTGYFPSIERVDMSFAAGVLHYQLNYDASIEVKHFLNKISKTGHTEIKNHSDFDVLSSKIAIFGRRFGIEGDIVKKILLGMSLSHVKTSAGVSKVEEKFPVYFGTDHEKIVLAVPTFSKGLSAQAILKEFCSALLAFHGKETTSSSIFLEFHHLVKAAQNVCLFVRPSRNPSLDPLYIVTRVPFPKNNKNESGTHHGYYFGFCQNPDADPLPDEIATKVVDMNEFNERGIPEDSEDNLATAQVSSLNQSDLNLILADPEIVGDPVAEEKASNDTKHFTESPTDEKDKQTLSRRPFDGVSKVDRKVAKDDMISRHLADVLPDIEEDLLHEAAAEETLDSKKEALNSTPEKKEQAPAESNRKLKDLEAEIDRLNQINKDMAEDIKRLMKERREPSTDREMQATKVRLQERLLTASLKVDELREKLNEKTRRLDELEGKNKKNKAA